MTIRPRGPRYLLFIAFLNLIVFSVLVTGIFFVRFADYANVILSGIFMVGALYVLRNALTFGLAYLQQPHFEIDISPGLLSLRSRRRELRIGSSDVLAYYIYNNKVLLRARSLLGQRNILPFARVRNGEFIVIYLYLIGDPAELLRGLRSFDDSFQNKVKVNVGMFVQAIGNV